MLQGKSSEEITKFEILKFLFLNTKAQNFKDIEHNCSGSRNTIKKYLEFLKDEGLVKQSIKGHHPYFLTDDGKKLAQKEFQKQKLKQQIDELSDTHVKSLFEFVDRILMKSVRLTINNALLENTLRLFRDGKISEEKLDEIMEYNSKLDKQLKNRRFFSDEEIEKMVHIPFSTKKEIEKLAIARIKWFDKWFGD